MKATRQSTGLVFLAYEQKDFVRVVENESRAREAVARTRAILEAYGTRK